MPFFSFSAYTLIAGMKELDQQLAAEEDEDNFNPDVDIRDYAEVAKSLPVFCVSSRGYQKLQGRLKKDPPVPGFQTLAETEIPQLQDHCERLTIAGRTATCKRFMTNLSQLINSMTLWGSNDGSGTSLTADQRVIEEKFLRKSLANLESVSKPQSQKGSPFIILSLFNPIRWLVESVEILHDSPSVINSIQPAQHLLISSPNCG